MFHGSIVALVTPMHDDGRVDFDALARLVEFHVENETNAIVAMGTTGESATLDEHEHCEVIRRTVEMVAGRIPVIAGTGANATSEAITLTRCAMAAGADAALLVTPYYNKPTQEGFFQHYQAIAESVEIPIVIYNIPGRTAKNIEPETIIRLAEIPNIVAVKESTGSMDQASHILSACDLTVLSGDDSLTLPLMALGGKGVVSVVGNIVPGDVKSMLNAFNAGDLKLAREWHFKLFALCRNLLGLATNPIPIKAAMQLLGRDNGEVRLPMTQLDSSSMKVLEKTLRDYGLL
ncbi:MAG: 4-hydroxy-tetrahydrodipicolinate synthase [Gammaproteobacteria bacterium]|nr:4-hydroxy-tetrahydrodipicolinate synthase [Gammaproteobacteria bacterium]